jgi:hypothetical protein
VADDNIRNVACLSMSGIDKKLHIGLVLTNEERFGHRICSFLNLGLADLPDEVIERIEKSRNMAIYQKK